jgi:hypothetical protein
MSVPRYDIRTRKRGRDGVKPLDAAVPPVLDDMMIDLIRLRVTGMVVAPRPMPTRVICFIVIGTYSRPGTPGMTGGTLALADRQRSTDQSSAPVAVG